MDSDVIIGVFGNKYILKKKKKEEDISKEKNEVERDMRVRNYNNWDLFLGIMRILFFMLLF